MNIKEISDFIVKLEKTVPINEIKYKKLLLWPVIRSYIYGSLLTDGHNNRVSVSEKKERRWINRIKSKLLHGRIAAKEVRKQKFEDGTDFLFWSRTVDHSDKIDGLPYNRHTDPYYELFNQKFKCRKLEKSKENKRNI